jgi:uncharacterized membrane protein YjgN (DUF898 family)
MGDLWRRLGLLRFAPTVALDALLLRHLLFCLATVNFYRFQARTEWRRQIWTSIIIDDEPLEYRGTANALFAGFVTAMVIGTLLLIIMSGVSEILFSDIAGTALVGNLLLLAVLVVRAAGDYGASQYVLRHTTWRGVHWRGSRLVFAGHYLFCVAVFLLSAGLAAPLACASLAKYRMRHTAWGDYRVDFSGSAQPLWPSWLLFWLIGLLPVGFLVAPIIQASHWDLLSLYDRTADALIYIEQHGLPMLLLGLGWFAVGAAAFLNFYLHWIEWLAGHSTIGPLELTCHFPKAQFFKQIRTGLIWIFVYLVAVLTLLFAMCNGDLRFMQELTATQFVWVIAVMLTLSWFGFRFLVVTQIYLPMLQTMVAGTTVRHLAEASHAKQTVSPRMRLAEGAADLLRGDYG